MQDFLCKASSEQPIWRDFQQVLLNPPSRIIHLTHDYAAAVLAVHHFLPGDFPQIFWNLFCLSGEYILSRAIPGFDEAD